MIATRRFLWTILAGISLLSVLSSSAASDSVNVLVVSKTAGFRHSSIGPAKAMLERYAASSSCSSLKLSYAESDSELQVAFASAEALSQYEVVVFLMTTGDIFDESQQSAMESWFRSGKGFVGVHSATDTEYAWSWYGNLTGTYFLNHPSIQEAEMSISPDFLDHLSLYGYQNASNPVIRTEEWYNFRNALDAQISILITVNESTYSGGNMGTLHPISWFQEFEGGRSFYTAMGHRDEAFDGSDPAFEKHLIGGIFYSAGEQFNTSAINCLSGTVPPDNSSSTVFRSEIYILIAFLTFFFHL